MAGFNSYLAGSHIAGTSPVFTGRPITSTLPGSGLIPRVVPPAYPVPMVAPPVLVRSAVPPPVLPPVPTTEWYLWTVFKVVCISVFPLGFANHQKMFLSM